MIVLICILAMPFVAFGLAWYANRQIKAGKKGWV